MFKEFWDYYPKYSYCEEYGDIKIVINVSADITNGIELIKGIERYIETTFLNGAVISSAPYSDDKNKYDTYITATLYSNLNGTIRISPKKSKEPEDHNFTIKRTT